VKVCEDEVGLRWRKFPSFNVSCTSTLLDVLESSFYSGSISLFKNYLGVLSFSRVAVVVLKVVACVFRVLIFPQRPSVNIEQIHREFNAPISL